MSNPFSKYNRNESASSISYLGKSASIGGESSIMEKRSEVASVASFTVSGFDLSRREIPEDGITEEDEEESAHSSAVNSSNDGIRIRVTDGETPTRALVLPMVELQQHLIQVNNRVTCGVGVSHEDWEKVRRLTVSLGEKFTDSVDFDWETTYDVNF